jgi:hypothetical protein
VFRHLGEEGELARVARLVLKGERSPEDFHDVFARAQVFARRPSVPGLFVSQVPGRGRWTVVFSTLDRLAAREGECDYLSAPGTDVLELVPEGVGVMVDPDDEHRFPILTRVATGKAIAQAWDRLNVRRVGL